MENFFVWLINTFVGGSVSGVRLTSDAAANAIQYGSLFAMALIIALTLGRTRQIGISWSLFLSFFLSPLTGLIAGFCSRGQDKVPPTPSRMKKWIGDFFIVLGVLAFLATVANHFMSPPEEPFTFMEDYETKQAILNEHKFKIIGDLLTALSVQVGAIGLGYYLLLVGRGQAFSQRFSTPAAPTHPPPTAGLTAQSAAIVHPSPEEFSHTVEPTLDDLITAKPPTGKTKKSFVAPIQAISLQSIRLSKKIPVWLRGKVNSKTILLGLVVVIAVHMLFLLNRVYYTHYDTGYDEYGDSETSSASALSHTQYRDMLDALDGDEKVEAISNTVMNFFGVIPGWTINLVYVLYAVAALLLLSKRKRS